MKKIFSGLLVLLTIATISSPCFADTRMERVSVNKRGEEAYTTYYRNYGDRLYSYETCCEGNVLVIGMNDTYGTFIYREELNSGMWPFNKFVDDRHDMPSGNYCVGGYIRGNSIFYPKDKGTFSWYKK